MIELTFEIQSKADNNKRTHMECNEESAELGR